MSILNSLHFAFEFQFVSASETHAEVNDVAYSSKTSKNWTVDSFAKKDAAVGKASQERVLSLLARGMQ